jgi:DNA/RNA-binding protein KIN17
MHLIGEDPKKYLRGFSNDFQRDFVNLLRVAHGEKFIGANRFYNEYIRDKEHIHMNATKWSSLTEFVKHLSREGIVNFKEDEKDGLMIAWRDTSIEAVRRREEIRAQEAAEMRNGAGEDKMLKRMEKRAREEAEARAKAVEARKAAEAQRAAQNPSTSPPTESAPAEATAADDKDKETPKTVDEAPKPEAAPVKISFGLKPKALPNTKPGLNQMKSQSIFKRARAENGEEKAGKKVKL